MAAQLSSSSPGLGYWGKELGNKKFEVSRLPVAIFQAVLFSYQDKAQPPLRSHLLGFIMHSQVCPSSSAVHAPSLSKD